MKKKNLLLVTPIFHPQAGGGAVFSRQIVKNLSKLDVTTVYVLTANSSDAPIYESENGAKVFRCLFSPLSIKESGTIARKIKILTNIVVSAAFAVFLNIFRRIDVVHIIARRCFVGVALISKLFNTITIIDGRNLGSVSFPVPGTFFVSCSKKLHRSALNERDRSEKKIYIPVPFQQLTADQECRIASSKTPNKYGDYLLYVGDIAERKGISRLITAFTLLREEMQEMNLIMIGTLLENQVPVDGVIYLSPMAYEDTLSFIKSSRLVVVPSKDESLSRVALEAIALDVPVIAPNTVEEFYEFPDIFRCSDDVSALKMKIDRLIHNPGVPEYNFDYHDEDRILELYRRLYKCDIAVS